MGRLVYVSFLGTNDYVASKYRLNDEVSEPTKFVQEAEITFLKDEIDEYIFFISKEANQKNWKNNSNYKYIEDFSDGYIGLEYILKEKLKIEKDKIKVIDIENILHPDGEKLNTKDFVYRLFGKIVENIEEGSKLIIDITHSFRSIPFVSFTAFKYLSYMKSVEIKNIFYGAFEDLGAPNDVIEIGIDDRIAEIVDLKPLLFLEEWASGIEDYNLYGRFTKLKELVDEEDIIKSFDNFEEIFLLGNGKEMFYAKKIEELKNKIGNARIIENPSLNEIVNDIKEKILKDLSEYNKNNLKNILIGIKFLIEKNQLVQATTLIIEFLYSYLCRKYSNRKNECETNYYKRELYQKTTWIIANEHESNEEEWKISDDRVKEKIRNLLNNITECEKEIIKNVYKNMNSLRNNLNHGGFKDFEMNINNLKEKIKDALSSLNTLMGC